MAEQEHFFAEHRIVSVDSLVPHPQNYKSHPPKQIAKLKASLIRFGQRKDIVIQPGPVHNLIVAGHGTVLAMQELGWSDVSASLTPSTWTNDDIVGYMVADNETANDAENDETLLATLLEEQKNAGYDLASLGSSDEELQDLLERLGDEVLDTSTSNDFLDNEENDDCSADPVLFSNDVIKAEAFKYFRRIGFPYRNLPVYRCMQELNKLASLDSDKLLNSRLGYHIADTYHPHRMHASAEGMKSPYEAFHDDTLLNRSFQLQQEYDRAIPLDILHTLFMISGTQACSNFRPGFAKYLYDTYCQQGNTVLDTSTGYGGRLVGFMASGITGKYIGIDPNTETHAANLHMAEDLNFTDHIELHNCPAEDVDPDLLRERCHFAFTSPPYFAKEHYSDEDTQSWKRYSTGDHWRQGFLQKMLRLQYIALKPGSYAIINIADVNLRNKTYPLVQWTIEDGQSVGFEYVETQQFQLQSGFASRDGEIATEPVIVFRKREHV